MYLGQMFEAKPRAVQHPLHFYTEALMSIPEADPDIVMHPVKLSGEIPAVDPPNVLSSRCHMPDVCRRPARVGGA
jgi:hypothetical protein